MSYKHFLNLAEKKRKFRVNGGYGDRKRVSVLALEPDAPIPSENDIVTLTYSDKSQEEAFLSDVLPHIEIS